MVEPRWIDVDVLIALSARIVAIFGEPHRLRDRGLLESAAAKPANLWAYRAETDLLALSIALMIGVAHNHPFLQGNKRTGFEAGLLLLNANGFQLEASLDSVFLADTFVEVIEHKVDEAAFAARLRPHVVPTV